MNKIDELVREMCPDGVEYKELGEICIITSGGDIPKENYSVTKTENFTVPIISNGVGEKALYGYTDIPKIIETAVTISARGTIGYAEYRDYSYYPVVRLLSIIPYDKNELNCKYLYYCLQDKKYNVPITGIPQLTIPMIKNILIPLPPLEIQEHIVNILDKFTDLTKELKHELDLRKKQYEYYRDMLLSFENCEVEVEKVRLGDIATIKNGKDYKQCGAGNYPVYGSGGIMAYIDNYVYDKPSVLIPRKGSLSNLYYVDKPFWNIDTIFYTQIDDRKVLPKYLYYLLLKERLESLNTAGGVPSLTQSVLNNIELSIPSIEIQKKIINVLDNFDALCNDLNAGLPAEIEMRTQQYEYYRDKLLSFK